MLKNQKTRIWLTCFFMVFVLFPFFSYLGAEQESSPGKSHGEEAFPFNWKRYYSQDELTEIYRALNKKYPYLVKLVSTGKSRQGRDIWLLELTNYKSGPAESKPALYIDGAIHGNEVQGIMCALYTPWYLLTRYGNDAYVTELLDTRAFYVKPTVNVDAAHAFVTEPNTMHHPRWNYRPVDNDGDGKFDEDPEEDINGDGEISLMRRRSPNGRWKVGDDPRLLVRCQPDEPSGGWELLGYEGIDNDGDGLVNEDIPGGLDLARNFPARWSISDGYPYPLSEPETKSTADYLLAHRNVGAIVHHHNFGQLIMISAGPYERREGGRIPFSRLGKYPTETEKKMEMLSSIQVPSERRADWQNYLTLARRGVEITDYRPTPGGGVGQFSAWGYEHFGSFTFLVELWNIPADFNEDGIVDDSEMLRWVDREFHGEGWVDWKPFKHPTYGDIEIGGTFKKFVRRATPGKYLEQLAMKMNDWSLYLAYNLPLIKISSMKITPLAAVSKAFAGEVSKEASDFVIKTKKASGKGFLTWVDVEVTNQRMLPTKSRMAHILKILPKDSLVLSGKNCEVFGYSELDRNLRPQKFEKKKRAEFDWVDGYETKRIRWLIKAEGSSTLEAVFTSARGGAARKQVSFTFD